MHLSRPPEAARYRPATTRNVARNARRIRLEIPASNFQRFARDMDTGLWAHTDQIAATTSAAFHDSQHDGYAEQDGA